MAPDRGGSGAGQRPVYQAISNEDDQRHESAPESSTDNSRSSNELQTREETQHFLTQQAASDTNFTVRGVLVGLGIGIIICFSNTYFGLQTGWASGMAMPSALLGFAFFKSLSRFIAYPFTPVENVLVQTVAGAVGTMP